MTTHPDSTPLDESLPNAASTDESLAIIRLGDLIETYSPELLHNELTRFSCTRNADVEEFLHHASLDFERADKSRTFLVVTHASLTLNSPALEIVGYFALALKHLHLGRGISTTKRKKLNGLFKPEGDVVVGYLIGQLAKNDHCSNLVSGTTLLHYALDLIREAQRQVGGRFVIVECQQEERLLAFYTRNGFDLLQIDTDDNIAQLVCFL